VQNAVKFNKVKGLVKITLDLSVANEMLTTTVQDTGCGMFSEQLRLLKEKTIQLDKDGLCHDKTAVN
jgi:signal transduction histidine kinase